MKENIHLKKDFYKVSSFLFVRLNGPFASERRVQLSWSKKFLPDYKIRDAKHNKNGTSSCWDF